MVFITVLSFSIPKQHGIDSGKIMHTEQQWKNGSLYTHKGIL